VDSPLLGKGLLLGKNAKKRQKLVEKHQVSAKTERRSPFVDKPTFATAVTKTMKHPKT